MKNRIYPSLAMLPTDDLANYLSIVHGFRSKNELAPDVERVDGVAANKIAVAATDPQGNLINGKSTIENALKLGGLEADQYLTIDNSQSLLVDAHNISRINADEIKNLRDELYQMKSELAKNGLIRDSYSYHGFQDPFKIGNIKYINKPITRGATVETRATISDITVVDASELLVGEYIVVEDAGRCFLTKIMRKEGNRLFISPSINGPLSTVAVIKRSLGMYHNSSFLFGEEHGQIISDREKHIILNDDTNTKALPRINKSNHGFATEFKVPKSVQGAITKFTVSLRGKGSPGVLKCYVADPRDNDGLSIYNMGTIEEMREAGKILGESDAISSSVITAAFNEREFVFSNPVLLEDKRYTIIIKCMSADEDNYWEFLGTSKDASAEIETVTRATSTINPQGFGGDLHTNINLYMLSEGVTSKALEHQITNCDLHFAITTNEVYENSIGYLQQGLYSTKVELPSNEQVTRIRVELKVNREGRFKVVDNPASLVVKAGDVLSIVNEDNKTYAGSIFSNETCPSIVIGNQISKVGTHRISNTAFSLAKDTYTPAGADVYRVGYNVVVTAKNKYIDYDQVNDPIKYKDQIVVPLELKAVIPGKEAGKLDSSSDRLIFEAELDMLEDSEYKLKGFNDLLVQVAWTNSGSTQAEMFSNPELAGAIYDITISTDRAYNKNTNSLVAKFTEEA